MNKSVKLPHLGNIYTRIALKNNRADVTYFVDEKFNPHYSRISIPVLMILTVNSQVRISSEIFYSLKAFAVPMKPPLSSDPVLTRAKS